jgi:ribosome-associated heat shock protein Hsp15
MRIDKLLWFLRFAASRSFAQQWVADGHIRNNGRRIEKPSTPVNVGDILTLPLRSGVQTIRLLAHPMRRGPASEAQSCYQVLDGQAKNPIAAVIEPAARGIALP